MINYKIYLLLIAIAFLSFSCSEDDEKKEFLTDEYIFQENKSYIFEAYLVSDTDNYKFEYVIETYDYVDINGKNSLYYRMYDENDPFFNSRDLYIYYENNKIFGLNSFFHTIHRFEMNLVSEFDKIENMKWQLCFDFTNPNFESNYHYTFNENYELGSEKTIVNSNLKCIELKDTTYLFRGKKNQAKKFTLTQNILVETQYENYDLEMQSEEEIIRNVIFIKGIGIVEDNYSIIIKNTYLDGEIDESNLETIIKLKEIK